MSENICKTCGQVDCKNKNHQNPFSRELEYSQPYRCQYCGSTECSNLMHKIKLLSVPYTQLRPKHKFMFFFIIVAIGILLLFCDVLIQMHQ